MGTLNILQDGSILLITIYVKIKENPLPNRPVMFSKSLQIYNKNALKNIYSVTWHLSNTSMPNLATQTLVWLSKGCFLKSLIQKFGIWRAAHPEYWQKTIQPYKHTPWIPRWNDVETVAFTSFQRGIHELCL